MNSFIPRPSQQAILDYQAGCFGIAAVPGAGKTHILSALAAKIIKENRLNDGQEVLIVTVVNAAVKNFETRIRGFFDHPLQGLYRYRVRTLHGLAHDIVREKPGAAGLENQFTILDEHATATIRHDVVKAWLASHSLETGGMRDYLDPTLKENKIEWIQREYMPEMLESLALAFIRSAKDRLLTPADLQARLDASHRSFPLAHYGCEVYNDYQRALAYRGAVDFDDLIRLSLIILRNDPEYLARLRYRYPYILEDEAQDSSRTQQEILSLLSGASEPGGGNWVRVGDSNQAIFESFTTADPELLRRFIQNNPSADMSESGRSQPAVIALANELVEWTMQSHPEQAVRNALALPTIQPVPPGYFPVNPPEDRTAVHLITEKFNPEQEQAYVASSVKGYLDLFAHLPDPQKPTIAILVPRNIRGVEIINALKGRGIETVEMISSTSNTRAVAGSLSILLGFLAEPHSARRLSRTYEVWRRDWRTPAAQRPSPAAEGAQEDQGLPPAELLALAKKALHDLAQVEEFIAPQRDDAWLTCFGAEAPAFLLDELAQFRPRLKRWLDAVVLPIDQLVLTLAQDVFTEAPDLALAHKLALLLRQRADEHPGWNLPELTTELLDIAKNERRFIGFSDDDAGFDPERHRGKVVVTTMHKAKGLEWDRVYLVSANNYDFPSNSPADSFISEKWFVRNSLNLEAEALAQLDALASGANSSAYQEGIATRRARLNYVRERLRLLYVAITRARCDLIISWNTGRNGKANACQAFQHLAEWQYRSAPGTS